METVLHEYLKKSQFSDRLVCIEHKAYIDKPLLILINGDATYICPECLKDEYGQTVQAHSKEGGWICKNCGLTAKRESGMICTDCAADLDYVHEYYEFACAKCQASVFLEEGDEEIMCGPCLTRYC